MVALLWPRRDRDHSNPWRVTGIAGGIAFLCRADSRSAFPSGVAPLLRLALIFRLVLLPTFSEITEVAGLVMATYFALDFERVHHDL